MAQNKTVAELNCTGTLQERAIRYVEALRSYGIALKPGEHNDENLADLGRFFARLSYTGSFEGVDYHLSIGVNRHGRLEAKWYADKGVGPTKADDKREFIEGKNLGFQAEFNSQIFANSLHDVKNRHAHLCDNEGIRAQLVTTCSSAEARVYDEYGKDSGDGEYKKLVKCALSFKGLDPVQAKRLAMAAAEILKG